MLPNEITPEWLSTVFDAEISAVTSERIGDGLVGLNLRVRMDVSGNEAVPESVVIKLPSLDETSKATGVALRNYEREVKFYEHIASTVDIRIPACYHGAWDVETGDFVLVLEDMAPAEQGDQVAGCDVVTAQNAVAELAKLHGPRWDDSSLNDHEFLTRRQGPEDAAQLTGLWTMFLPGFLATYRRYLSVQAIALLEAFGLRLGDWVESRSGPVTVTHGDYRLDNLLFKSPTGGPIVTAVDWQTPGHGGPVGDLAYFCGAGLLSPDRRTHEMSLLDVYRNGLAAYGVDIEPGWLLSQYRREAFGGVVMAVVASQVVGKSDRSEAMFAAMASRHLQHCLDLDSLQAVD
ncbi:MAG: thiamine kinase-like enzyme [Ilumatobacter sp.]|jgi:thiamine kinase-like enzyme